MRMPGFTPTMENRMTHEPDSSTAIADAVRQYLDHDHWNYDTHEKGGLVMFTAGVNLPNGEFRVSFDADDAHARFGVYVYAPVYVPAAKRPAVAEFITRVNYIRFLGKIEMDLDDGEIRSVATVCVEGSHLSQAMIQDLENAAHFNLNDAYPGIMAVAYGDVSSKDAFAAYLQRDKEEPTPEAAP
jgi:hypothetical protein